jgi:RES domain-containing protein
MAFQYRTLLKAYRIADSRRKIFSGEGAERYGGRWNPVGRPVIYASQSLACAMLESLVHLNDIPIPNSHKYIEITSENRVFIEEVSYEELANFNISNEYETKEYGNKWLEEQRTLVLLVPSIIVPKEKNVVINPNHKEFNQLKASNPEFLKWDRRLFS